jgi:hypothetical protein
VHRVDDPPVRRGRVGAEIRPTDAGDERIRGRPFDRRNRDRRPATGVFVSFALPPSPDEPSTVTPFAAAFLNA